LNGAGPGDISFNEFNPLFNRNRYALQVSGLAGENSTWGDEVVLSGVYDKFSISAGQFHFETDGYRENNDQDQDVYNVFSQVSLTHKTSVLAEFRATDIEKGDLRLNFVPEDFKRDLRETEETESVRLGLRHSFSSHSDIIATVIYKNRDYSLDDFLGILPLDISSDEDGYTAEVQHLFRAGRFDVISGAGYFSSDGEEALTIASSPPEIDDIDTDHTNVYLYVNINYPQNVTWTVGGSGDFFDSVTVDQDQFNPKLGLIWNPFPDTTVRAAVFRVLKRSLISNQTIETTQVAGFNQFFDDAEGTDAWRYGVAVDQKFTPDLYGGAEFSQRNLEVPFSATVLPSSPPPPPPPAAQQPPPPPPPSSPSVTKVLQTDWEEYLGRAYLYWTPYPFLALSVEYEYERFDRDRDKGFVAGIADVETHRYPLGINFYHSSGFSAGVRATYIDQKGTFQPTFAPPGTFTSGEDHFWVVDASVGYRLPKRLGLITIDAKNLFDKSFNFQDTDPAKPAIQPDRVIFAKFTLAL
jgi:hypothetical protein